MVIALYLPAAGVHAYRFISRSSGIVAYMLLTLSVLWGLVQSGALFRRRVPPVLVPGLHSLLSWWGLALRLFHGLILLGDRYLSFTLAQVVTPFAADYRPVATGLGSTSFYGALVLSLTFYARRFLGHRTFRLLHCGSFGVFALLTAF